MNQQTETDHVLRTPLWVVILRGLQFLVSLIIVGLCGWMIHDAGLPENSLCIAIVSYSTSSMHLYSLSTLLTSLIGSHYMDSSPLHRPHRKAPRPSKRIPNYCSPRPRWFDARSLARSLGGYCCSTSQICCTSECWRLLR